MDKIIKVKTMEKIRFFEPIPDKLIKYLGWTKSTVEIFNNKANNTTVKQEYIITQKTNALTDSNEQAKKANKIKPVCTIVE